MKYIQPSVYWANSHDENAYRQEQQTNADVEQRQLTEELLRTQAELEQFRILYEHLSCIYFTLDSTGVIFAVNQLGASRLGYSNQALIQKPIFSIVHPQDQASLQAEFIDLLQQTVHTDTPQQMACWEFRACCKDGSIIWLKAIARPVQKSNTNTVILFICEEITQQKQAEEALDKERHLLTAIIDTVETLVVVLDRQGRIIRFNRACEQITNYSFEEVKNKTFWDLFLIPEEVELVKANFKQLQAGNFPSKNENYWVTKDGSHRLIAWSNTALLDADGSVEYIIGTGIDITERKHTQEQLRQYRHRLEHLVEERTAELTRANQQLKQEIAYRVRTQEELSRRNQELITLHRISEITLTAQSLEVAFQLIVEEISAATGFPIVAIELYDETRQMMVFAGTKGIPLPANQSVLEIPVDQTLSGTVARTGEAVVKTYVPQESKKCDNNEALSKLGIKTFICMPMLVKKRAFGVLSLAHPDTVECDAHCQRWIKSLANYIASLTEGKQAQEALKASEERYRQIIETAAEGIWILDADSKTSFVNSKMTEMLGYSVAEMLGMPLFAFMNSEGVAIALDRIERRRQGIKEQHDFKFRRKDGSELWAIVSTNPILDHSGKYIGALGMLTDITERKITESALKESEARLRLSLEAAQMVTWDWNIVTNTIEYSDQIEPVFGLPRGYYHATYEDFLNSIHPEDREAVEQAVARAIEERAGYSIEFRVFWPDGSLHWVGSKGQVYSDKTGIPMRMIGVAMDITDRKNAESALWQQTKRERLMGEVAQRIRQSLNLKEILSTTVAEVRQFLQTDRVLIYRFEPDWSGIVVVEAVGSEWRSILGQRIQDHCFRENYVHLYKNGRIKATEDIYAAGLAQCHIDIMAQFQVRANLVVPILQSEQTTQNPKSATQNRLWGLLIAHHCSQPRKWQQLEIDLLKQLATQVAIAIQQAELYQQLEIANKRLHCLASVDGLTQIANRRHFDEYLEKEWRRMAREQLPLALILCDIDFFKLYNDTYGHQPGDICLQQVSGAIRLALKRPADLVARYGGEEFAVILPNTSAIGAFMVAESIRSMVKSLEIVHVNSPVNPYVTLSLGVCSMVPSSDNSPRQLIAAADMALYQAKAEGRDRGIIKRC
jgi:diguanylate cyclase (GGDEF)-like protein/PAS domain S-box-containing protein